MPKIIYCYVDIFAEKAKVMQSAEDGVNKAICELPIRELAVALPQICYYSKTNKMHLFGPTPYLNGLIEDMVVEPGQYNNQYLEIEVN